MKGASGWGALRLLGPHRSPLAAAAATAAWAQRRLRACACAASSSRTGTRSSANFTAPTGDIRLGAEGYDRPEVFGRRVSAGNRRTARTPHRARRRRCARASGGRGTMRWTRVFVAFSTRRRVFQLVPMVSAPNGSRSSSQSRQRRAVADPERRRSLGRSTGQRAGGAGCALFEWRGPGGGRQGEVTPAAETPTPERGAATYPPPSYWTWPPPVCWRSDEPPMRSHRGYSFRRGWGHRVQVPSRSSPESCVRSRFSSAKYC